MAKRNSKSTAKPFRLEDLPIELDDSKKICAPGVQYRCLPWGFFFHGKQHDVIEAGVAQPEWFTDGKQRDKLGRIRRRKALEVGGRHIKTVTFPPGPCSVYIHYTNAEQKKYDALKQQKQEAEPAPEANVVVTFGRGAKFEVGAFALIDGDTVEIAAGYQLCNVRTQGSQMGYCVKREEDSKPWFAPAHKLRLCDGGISHLKLVKG